MEEESWLGRTKNICFCTGSAHETEELGFLGRVMAAIERHGCTRGNDRHEMHGSINIKNIEGIRSQGPCPCILRWESIFVVNEWMKEQKERQAHDEAVAVINALL